MFGSYTHKQSSAPVSETAKSYFHMVELSIIPNAPDVAAELGVLPVLRPLEQEHELLLLLQYQLLLLS